MKQIKDNMTPYITRKEIYELVSKLAKQIESDYRGKEIVMICALKGSILFLADLMRQIRLPQQVDFVQTKSEHDPRSKEPFVKIIKDLSINISGKHVLIIEEIIDSGRALNFLKSRLLASAPASLKIVTLLDKPARRTINIKADYIGKVIEDRYVVGYGLDQDELGRNYPDIYFPKH